MDDCRFNELIAKVKAGDEAAAGCLFAACRGSLRLYVNRQMGPLLHSRMDPDDVLQDVYAAAWANVQDGQFDGFAGFQGWLRRIAKNRMIDLRRALLGGKHDVRKEAGRPIGSSSSVGELLERLPGSGTTPSRLLARREAHAIAIACLALLPEDHRDVIRLRFFERRRAAEVGRIMGRSEDAVNHLFTRALRNLREMMGSASTYLSGS